MANTNTTTTVNRLSNVLSKQCEKTQKNIKKLARDAGCKDDEKFWNVRITKNRMDAASDVLYAGLNGVSFHFLRGTAVVMPEAVLEILERNHEDEIIRIDEVAEAPKKVSTRKKKAEEAASEAPAEE